ncbi:hypothetical protein JI667_06580 [Bacillus sp. NTK074B]|uniref:hypothetical protein n=1 Tax=Bacillus sp. NTK074B TaxID=2802174 RepID=UPI001A8F15C4|nr:hypothetical protein [Bacillus sp. NTK074B]
MNYFIGINPPEEYKSRISAFRNKWKNNFIDDIVEPHITLKAQGGLKEGTSPIEVPSYNHGSRTNFQ